MAALLALAATPAATAAEGQRLAQAQGRQPDPGKATDAERVAPLKWLNYSSERFRTLMRLLAARAARSEAKRAADAKAEEEAKQAAEARAADDARHADEARRASEAKAAEEAKRAAKAADDARRADEARRIAEAKAAEDARRADEAKAGDDARLADEAKRAAEAKAAEDAKRAAETKVAEEARAAEDAKRAAQAEAAKRAADARKAPETAQADERPATDKPADAGKAAPAPEPRRRAPASCRNAGLKVAGAGWYVVQPGDSLWSIARVHYGYGRSYRRIHFANRRTIADPRRIYPCQRIYVPRARFGEAPLQGLRVALEPFIRRRAMDAARPGIVD